MVSGVGSKRGSLSTFLYCVCVRVHGWVDDSGSGDYDDLRDSLLWI